MIFHLPFDLFQALDIIRRTNSPVNLIAEKYFTPNVGSNGEAGGQHPIVRSDSIKSLPTNRQR